MIVARFARARRPAGRISALAFPKLGHSPHSSAGFAVWGAGRRRPENACVWGPRALGPQKTQGVFGVPRVRAMKSPARFPGPGLGTLLKDIFLYLSSVSTSRSQKLQVTSCTEIVSCTMQRLYSASQEIFAGHPHVLASVLRDDKRNGAVS
jgi:hypothetical protein